MKLMLLIYRANSSEDKRYSGISEAREVLEVIQLLLRLTKDLKQITLEDFVSLSKNIENISKQLLGWQRSSARKI